MSKKLKVNVTGFFQALFNGITSTIKTIVWAFVGLVLVFLLIITGFVTALVNILT